MDSPYQMYFLPIQSKNVPDFPGVYYTYPRANIYERIRSKAELLQYDSVRGEAILNSTIFAFGETSYNTLKSAFEFPHIVNSEDFVNDIWTINGKTYEITGSAGFLWGKAPDWESAQWPVVQHYYTNVIGSDFQRPDNLESADVASAYYCGQEIQQDYYGTLFSQYRRLTTISNKDIALQIYRDIYGGAEPVKSVGSIKLYKNLILMNGARIRRGT